MEVDALFSCLDIPRINQVYVMFRGRLAGGSVSRRARRVWDTRLFDEADVPWDEIAFPAISHTLELWFQDRRNGTFVTHTGVIHRRAAP